MLNGKTFLAIIPARGGSKRLPRKNVLDLAGKPLVAWTIEAAIESKYIDKVVVSSDDHEILTVAKEYGAVILKRPDELANDTSTSFEAVEHAISQNSGFDCVVLLQATSPLRTTSHIDEAITSFEDKHADAVISVCEMEHSPLWSNTLPKDGAMVNFLSHEVLNKRSQDLESYYRLNGAIYIVTISSLLDEKTFFLEKNVFSYVMSKNCSVDIDEDIDFYMADKLMQNKIKVE